ncbi:sulfotransferase domain-containing protein [Paenibacillus mesophilus]|uniref:sulfotransferase domain-containing protein n=1 Tax=Paenibacillus mesophilus TaxID=2582849 RepID=UPI00192E4F8C|nr:sulfotransferase domain-containing protein [Paenibacillus mesophilus]
MNGLTKGNLPHFLIIGVQKGGTTSLYHYLTQHPNIASATEKEVHYFDYNFHKGIDWYRSHFPHCPNDKITGEASPYYMFHPHAAKRIKAAIPSVKLIALLRNPVERTISSYKMMHRRKKEHLSFEQAMQEETSRIRDELPKMLGDPNYFSKEHFYFSYLSRSVYADQLEPYFKRFPREQILILKSEDLFTDPSTVYRKTLKFLNLPLWEPNHYDIMNKGKYKRDIPKETLNYLTEYFRPHNQRLYRMLGVDLGWDR